MVGKGGEDIENEKHRKETTAKTNTVYWTVLHGIICTYSVKEMSMIEGVCVRVCVWEEEQTHARIQANSSWNIHCICNVIQPMPSAKVPLLWFLSSYRTLTDNTSSMAVNHESYIQESHLHEIRIIEERALISCLVPSWSENPRMTTVDGREKKYNVSLPRFYPISIHVWRIFEFNIIKNFIAKSE